MSKHPEGHVGYHQCPCCGATYASTHYSACPHSGLDPRDIRSPLSDTNRQAA